MEKESKETCYHCGKLVYADDIGITRKLINRGTTRYYCISCLADAFELSVEDVQEKIRYYKSIGCTLFPSDESL